MRYIYCHPLFDERKCSHRFSFQLSETFSRQGLNLERFDYQGTGEASGKFSDVTMQSLRKDLDNQISGQEVLLIGVRFGADLVFDYLFRNPDNVKLLILIEPVIEGSDYIKYLFQKQRVKDLMTGTAPTISRENGFYNLEGYKTNSLLIEQLKEFSLTKMAKDFNKKKTIRFVYVSPCSGMNNRYNILSDFLKNNGSNVDVLRCKLPPFWERLPLADYSKLTDRILECCSD